MAGRRPGTLRITAPSPSVERSGPPPRRPGRVRRPGTTARSHHFPAPLPPLADQLDPPAQLLPHHLIARVLHRVEIARDLLVLFLIELRQGGAVALPRVHQLAHAVVVRRDAGPQLRAQSLEDGALPPGDVALPLEEPAFGRL